MNILQICAYGAEYPGNFINTLEQLEKKLLKEGHKTIYAFADTAKGKEWCKKIQQRTKVYFLSVAKARISPNVYKLCKNIFKENKIDIVHSHFELYDMPISVTAPKDVKIFWHLHDPIEEYYKNVSMLKKILWSIQYSKSKKNIKILSVSKKHGNFIKTIGLGKKDVEYFPNGIDTNRIERIDEQVPKNQFLLFGWEVYRKGVDLAYEASKYFSQNNYNLQVECIGKDECKKYLESKEKNNCISYKEPVSDINSLYKKTNCFLHISRAEGLSYALLEAIYAGLPVICSDIEENLFAKEFENVFFIKNENVEDIIDKMKFIMSEKFILDKEKIQSNRKIIEEKYSIDSWCRNLINLYKV